MGLRPCGMGKRSDPDPRTLWPDLSGWEAVGMDEPVFRVHTALGAVTYVRPDDGSPPLLRRLATSSDIPLPGVLDAHDGWLLLSACPGIPLHTKDVWHKRPDDAARIVVEALRTLERAGVTHGDLCLPNILGDPETGRLSGIIDWRFAERYGREVDVAAAIWSRGYNGFDEDVALNVLHGINWPRTDAAEVQRLRRLWEEGEY